MGKWAKPDLSDLENDLLNNSMKSISFQLINIIPRKLYARNKEKLSDCNWQKVEKQPNYPPCEASCINREKVIKQFFEKIASK